MQSITDDNLTPQQADELWRKFMTHKVMNFLSPLFPEIITLCGSTRFKKEFIEANYRLTMAGKIVISVGWFSHADAKIYTPTEAEKKALDELHFRKIDLSDSIFVLNVLQPWCPACKMHCMPPWEGRTRCCDATCEERGYIGSSTRNEIEYARSNGKEVRFLNPE